MSRIVGIDYGDRWSGLALSDPTRILAWPLKVVDGEAALFAELRVLLKEEGVDLIVIGLPLNMDGTVGPRARQVIQLKEKLERELGVPVEAWDERLTTFQAHAALTEGGLSGRKRADRVDKVAAQILLQSYLDRQKGIKGGDG